RFKPRSNRYHSRRPNARIKSNNGVYQLSSQKNNFSRTGNSTSKNPYNLEKIIEKYKNLAKEALSVGDKILHESYLQHSDHFSRILSEVNTLKTKNNIDDKSQVVEVSKNENE
ncbi:MAG: DUF4167 domain-containing protein, partial [Pelagibacteraceae bacterium]|nr:DUF4167 domain-containing protein [Pelagibacteraceae bacterium]